MPTTTTGIATEFIQFTRASNATVTDSDGIVKWAPNNLLLNSESFDAASWLKVGGAVAANTTVAPNGTTTADTYTAAASSARHCFLVSSGIAIPTSAQHTASVYLKKGNYNYVTVVFLSLAASGYWTAATVDFSGATPVISQTQTSASSTALTPTIESAANGFWRVSLTGTLNNTTVSVEVALASSATPTYDSFGEEVWTAAGTETVIAWGASLYRSDLGGMQPNTSAYPLYNPTTVKNMVGYSESLSNTYWTKTDTSVVTSGVTNPRGLIGASLVYPSSSGTSRAVYKAGITGVVSTTYTISVYAKANGVNFLYFGTLGGGTTSSQCAFFDLQNGVRTQVGSLFTSATITPVGSDGWYRCSAVASATLSTLYPIFGISDANNSGTVTASGTSGIYLWGAQLSDSASLDTYAPVYEAAVTSAAYYGPRRDFNGSTLACNGLLVEEQRTNSLQYSNAFTTSPWSTGGTPTATQNAVGPDGLTSAWTINDPSAVLLSYYLQAVTITNNSNTHVASIYIKKTSGAVTFPGFGLFFTGGTGVYGEYALNTNTGVATAKSTNVGTSSSRVVDVGQFWRIEVSATNNSTGNTTANAYIASAVNADASSIWLVTTIGSCVAYGAQLELDSSFATSYIPNLSTATATRNNDVSSVSTQAFPYGASEGTLVLAHDFLNPAQSTIYYYPGSIGDGQASPFMVMGFYGNGDPFTQVPTTSLGTSLGFTSSLSKIGIAFTGSSQSGSKDGSAASSSTMTATLSAAALLRISGPMYGLVNYSGHIRQITYLPRRVTNAELQTRTA